MPYAECLTLARVATPEYSNQKSPRSRAHGRGDFVVVGGTRCVDTRVLADPRKPAGLPGQRIAPLAGFVYRDAYSQLAATLAAAAEHIDEAKSAKEREKALRESIDILHEAAILFDDHSPTPDPSASPSEVRVPTTPVDDTDRKPR